MCRIVFLMNKLQMPGLLFSFETETRARDAQLSHIINDYALVSAQ